ncbi:hypothetical protein GY45DRAFT_917648 [Cubamyces sp. BRFM 1775]|nr:hypothetical protein GY45DRAFT_917648 [Cubamyces sp. BRFM 1775]
MWMDLYVHHVIITMNNVRIDNATHSLQNPQGLAAAAVGDTRSYKGGRRRAYGTANTEDAISIYRVSKRTTKAICHTSRTRGRNVQVQERPGTIRVRPGREIGLSARADQTIGSSARLMVHRACEVRRRRRVRVEACVCALDSVRPLRARLGGPGQPAQQARLVQYGPPTAQELLSMRVRRGVFVGDRT